MAEVTLRGRKIPLVYTVFEMKTVQEEICPLGNLQYILFGKNPDDAADTSRYAGPEHLNAVARMVRILGNAGLEEAGEKPDLTDKWVMRSLRPVQLIDAVNACVIAMNEGVASEIPPDPEEGPVDVVLEDIEKKKEKES